MSSGDAYLEGLTLGSPYASVTIHDGRGIKVPECMPEIKGIALGGCVNGKRFRRRAHAHNHKGDPMFGWVCFLAESGPSRRNPWPHLTDDEPSDTLWHEYAHILTPNHGHDTKWKAKMRELGRVVPRRYE